MRVDRDLRHRTRVYIARTVSMCLVVRCCLYWAGTTSATSGHTAQLLRPMRWCDPQALLFIRWCSSANQCSTNIACLYAEDSCNPYTGECEHKPLYGELPLPLQLCDLAHGFLQIGVCCGLHHSARASSGFITVLVHRACTCSGPCWCISRACLSWAVRCVRCDAANFAVFVSAAPLYTAVLYSGYNTCSE